LSDTDIRIQKRLDIQNFKSGYVICISEDFQLSDKLTMMEVMGEGVEALI